MPIMKSMASDKKKKRARPHAQQGRQALTIAILVVVMLAAGVAMAFFTHGTMPNIMGAVLFIALIASLIGLRKGYLALREPQRRQRYTYVSIALNILSMLVLLLIFWLGIG